ncbi:MAG: hypothetical protein WCJ58_02570 [bacterium]
MAEHTTVPITNLLMAHEQFDADGQPAFPLMEEYQFLRVNPDQFLEINPDRPTLLVVIGPSAVGKDTIVDKLIEAKLVRKITTATTRARRVNIPGKEDEAPDSYIWLAEEYPRVATESDEEYYDRLKTEARLVEFNQHDGNLYGLPEASITKALAVNDSQALPVVRTEINGAVTIKAKFQDQYNVIIIAIEPDEITSLLGIIKTERAGASLDIRIARVKQEIEGAQREANLFVQNTHKTVAGKKGLDVVVAELKKFLQELHKNTSSK